MTALKQLSVPLAALEGVAVGLLPQLVHLRVAAHSSSGPLSRSPSMLSPLSAADAALAPHLAAAKALVELLTVDPAHPERGAGTRARLSHFTLPGEWRDRADCTEPGEMRRCLERLGRACRREGVRVRFDARGRGRVGGWRVGEGEGMDGAERFWEPEERVW